MSSARVRELKPLSAGRVLKSYLWWTHERGSVPYDIMVTLILAFIFLTPHWIHYGDQPKPDWPTNEIRASVNPAGGMIYVVPSAFIHTTDAQPSTEDLTNSIAQVAGPVAIDRWEAVHEVGGRVVAWRVWAHRPS
jgi:hypothetical protein